MTVEVTDNRFPRLPIISSASYTKKVATQPHAQAATVYAHPDVLAFLYEEEEEWLDTLEAQLNTRFFFRTDSDFDIEQYEIEITEKRPAPKAKPKKARPKKKRATPRKRRTAKTDHSDRQTGAKRRRGIALSTGLGELGMAGRAAPYVSVTPPSTIIF